MIPVLSRAQIRAFDQYAIETCKVPSLVLMENAGRGAADILARFEPRHLRDVVIVCGTGNNGGDGFVVGRHLLARGIAVRCIATAPRERMSPDARANFDAYVGVGGRVVDAAGGSRGGAFEDLDAALDGATLAIDALFGTGLARPLEGHIRRVVEAMNLGSFRRVALDIPSGIDADTGAELGVAVRADETITFGAQKIGLLAPEGARFAGRVHVVDLGVPLGAVVDHVGHVAELIASDRVAGWLSPRARDTYKHKAGSVLVVAGSRGKLGAALIVGQGALRAGAGLVTLGTWPEAIDALESRVVELMTERIDRHDTAASLERVLVGKRVVVVGPGLGLDAYAQEAIEHIVFRWDGVKIVDADALTLFAGRIDELASAKGALVLTPHSGEAGRLLGCTTDAIERDRPWAARELARRARATAVLKGARSIIAADPGLPLFINTSGNPALATAGAGDVLAGIIAALACHLGPREAAAAGVHIHGLAADAWCSEHGGADRGLLATEVAEAVPRVLAGLARTPGPLTV